MSYYNVDKGGDILMIIEMIKCKNQTFCIKSNAF